MGLPFQGMTDWAKGAAKKFSKGKFTASQTGAKAKAAEDYSREQMKEISDAAQAGTTAFENRAISRSPKPKRTKRY